MTWLVAIDESGDTGGDSRYFTMAAVMVPRSRNLLAASKLIPNDVREFKFYRGSSDDIRRILSAVSDSTARVVYVTVDKHDYSGSFYGMFGKALYKGVLAELMKSVLAEIAGHDTNIMVDESSFITVTELKTMAEKLSTGAGCNVKRCEKAKSHHNKCIQIADLVAGSIQRSLEYGDESFVEGIRIKISVARKL